MVIVAQLVRASDCGSEGRGFETHHSPKGDSEMNRFFYYLCIMIEEIVEQKILIDPILLEEINEKIEEEKQVIIHFSLYADLAGDMARIWKSTYLIDVETQIKYPLLWAEGISYAPQWTQIPSTRPLDFTLIFKGLPKSCKTFDLLEIIPEDGGFEIRNVRRNNSDVYYVS